MRYGSVCSGIEAATCAWHPLGWKPVFFSEIEAFPSAVLKHHYPEVPNLGDFTKIGCDEDAGGLRWGREGSAPERGDVPDAGGEHERPDDIHRNTRRRNDRRTGAIDLLVGGTPCQDFSVAGLRAGMDGDRGNLTLEFLKLADRLRPKWLVWENVPGVLSSNGGRDFGSFLGGLGKLGYGYAYRVLDAQYFGVAQRRRRVFVVGHLGDWRASAAVLFERDCLSGNPAPSREKGKDITGTLGARTKSGGGFGGDFECAGGLQPVAKTLITKNRLDFETETFIPTHVMTLGHSQSNGLGISETETANTLEAVSSANQAVATPINTQLGLRGAETSNTSREGIGIGNPGDPMFTIQENHSHAVQTGMAVRRLTPRECERLQGFEDDYTLIPWRGKMAPDGPRYKAIGNSMAVPVMNWIGRRIEAAESEEIANDLR